MLLFRVIMFIATWGMMDSRKPKHVVVMIADDLGWNEVSWNNPAIQTPHMQKILKQAMLLTHSYTTPKCSPSRAALMTGYYPWRIGMQRSAIARYQPLGLNTTIKILPEYLKEAGYSTHIVGKWHLGYCHEDYLPTNRGFDSHLGQWSHRVNYYNRITDPGNPKFLKNYNIDKAGYDWHENQNNTEKGVGRFSTEVITERSVQLIKNHNISTPLFLYVPFQAPHEPIQEPPKKYLKLYSSNARNRLGRNFNRAATISALDYGVGAIVRALKKKKMFQDSLIIFSTDNGGSNPGFSNVPLRGNKEQLYEGGIRGVGWVAGGLVKKDPRSRNANKNQLIYISDWFSTILDFAGLKQKIPSDVDSYSLKKMLTRNSASPRKEIIVNLDEDTKENLWSGAIIKNNLKFLWGQTILLKQKRPRERENIELYNLLKDPYEKNNLANKKFAPKLIETLKKKIRSLLPEMKSAHIAREDKNGWPGRFKGKRKGLVSTGWCDSIS